MANKHVADAEATWKVCNINPDLCIVNGKVVNKGTGASVTKGKIVLQSEGAEVFYRNITLKPVKQ